MPKPIKLLVTDTEDEVVIHNLETLAEAGMTEEEADAAFTGAGYWLTLVQKRNTFADQQTAQREAAGDESLLPQKRFVLAIESIEKRLCGAKEASLPAVKEEWFTSLDPPALGNVIIGYILAAWYPMGSKTTDFMKAFLMKRDESEKASK